MNAMELIRHRRSVRTFDGNPLKEEDINRILSITADAENPYKIPITWKLLDIKKNNLKSPVIVGADTFIAGKMQQVSHAEEAFGYSFEKIVLGVEAIGIGTTWIAGTMDRPAFERAMGLGDGEVMPCVSPVGYPAKKMSLREGVMRKGVKADSRMPFGELFFSEEFGKPAEISDKMRDILEMVRWAPSAVNKQPWRVVVCGGTFHFYEQKSRGYVSESGWDLQKIDMGIALYHFAFGAASSGLHADFVLDDPGIAVPDHIDYVASYVVKDL